MNTVTVIIPVGPGHAEIVNEAIASVYKASKKKGKFKKPIVCTVDDTKGKLGRSAARNMGVKNATTDWVFFLDSDDLMHPKAFKYASDYLDYDGIWGDIYSFSDEQLPLKRPSQVYPRNLNELRFYDPTLTIQMGHFVRREIALENPFNEEMDCAEDFDYYLRVWKGNCIKINKPLFYNRRGQHSTGPRSASGGDWNEKVKEVMFG